MTTNDKLAREAFEAWAEQAAGFKDAGHVMTNEWLAWQASSLHDKQTIERLLASLKALGVAHAMSHEAFCDSGHWKEEFEKELQSALTQQEPA